MARYTRALWSLLIIYKGKEFTTLLRILGDQYYKDNTIEQKKNEYCMDLHAAKAAVYRRTRAVLPHTEGSEPKDKTLYN